MSRIGSSADATRITASSLTSHRHLGDASRPSGKKRGTARVTTAQPTPRTACPVTANAEATGTLPGWATMPCRARSTNTSPSAHSTPPPSISQPTRLRGRAAATTAPTSAKARPTAALNTTLGTDRSSFAVIQIDTPTAAADTATAAAIAVTVSRARQASVIAPMVTGRKPCRTGFALLSHRRRHADVRGVDGGRGAAAAAQSHDTEDQQPDEPQHDRHVLQADPRARDRQDAERTDRDAGVAEPARQQSGQAAGDSRGDQEGPD